MENLNVSVDADRLRGALKSVGHPLPLIVLSSCAGTAAGMHGLAATLIRRGADRVIAMQTSVTDDYATLLTATLYAALAQDPTVTVGAALATARRRVGRT